VSTVPDGARHIGALRAPMWRALAVFRFAALAYAAALVVLRSGQYAHPAAGWAVLACMVVWTVFVTYRYARPPGWNRWPVLWADLAVSVVFVLASRVIVGPEQFQDGLTIVPVTWHAGPVLAWALAGGRRLGLTAAVIVGVCDVYTRWEVGLSAVTGAVIMLLAAASVGYVVRLATQAEERLQQATRLEAAARERARLARDIHDSVLQMLAMVQRRGVEMGGEAAELGRLAGQQEAALRALVTGMPSGAVQAAGGPTDLVAELERQAGPDVTLAVPAGPVPLPAPTADAVTGAVAAALDNVRRHGGSRPRAWVLVENEAGTVTVTVRDDGPGIPPGRLAAAASEGRLGVSQSIRGRIAEVGGTVTITSEPGQGTEVEIGVPVDHH
jgi:signal transduction histidine kinase